MSTEKRVFSKLFKSKKIDLSIAADLDAAVETLNELMSSNDALVENLSDIAEEMTNLKLDLDYTADLESESFEELREQGNVVDELLGLLESKVGELGFSPSDLFPDYNDTIYLIENINGNGQKRDTVRYNAEPFLN